MKWESFSRWTQYQCCWCTEQGERREREEREEGEPSPHTPHRAPRPIIMNKSQPLFPARGRVWEERRERGCDSHSGRRGGRERERKRKKERKRERGGWKSWLSGGRGRGRGAGGGWWAPLEVVKILLKEGMKEGKEGKIQSALMSDEGGRVRGDVKKKRIHHTHAPHFARLLCVTAILLLYFITSHYSFNNIVVVPFSHKWWFIHFSWVLVEMQL